MVADTVSFLGIADSSPCRETLGFWGAAKASWEPKKYTAGIGICKTSENCYTAIHPPTKSAGPHNSLKT